MNMISFNSTVSSFREDRGGVRLFACDIQGVSNEKKWQRALSRRLLNIAVSETWGIERLEFEKTAGGKPYFPGGDRRFLSISHTATHVMVGVSDSELGVDIEAERPVRDGLAERLFSPEELRDLGFFGGWTVRESIFKLTGASSLYTLRLFVHGIDISCEVPGVKCRAYNDVAGCSAAAACYDGNFAPKIEIVPIKAIYP